MGRLGSAGGTPIEEAPLWVLGLLAVLLALVFFPALVGLAEVAGIATAGHRGLTALAAGLLALVVVSGNALQRPWRRTPRTATHDPRPLFTRLSFWLWTVLLYPNLLHGLLVLTHDEPVDPRASYLIGLGVSAIQGLLTWRERRRRARDASP